METLCYHVFSTKTTKSHQRIQNNHQEHKFVIQFNIRTGIGATNFFFSVIHGSLSVPGYKQRWIFSALIAAWLNVPREVTEHVSQ